MANIKVILVSFLFSTERILFTLIYVHDFSVLNVRVSESVTVFYLQVLSKRLEISSITVLCLSDPPDHKHTACDYLSVDLWVTAVTYDINCLL